MSIGAYRGGSLRDRLRDLNHEPLDNHRSQYLALERTCASVDEMQTVCQRFANGLLAPRRNQAICRAFVDRPKTQLLIAMQKVVGSSPISRLREARSWSGFFAFCDLSGGRSVF